VALVLAIFFTHRIAGPAYHLKQDLKKIQAGDLTIQTAFRKGDLFKDVAEAMNEATGQLRQEITAVKQDVDDLIKVSGDEAKVKEKLIKLRETLDKLKT
jgi:methyl-accepting chemotaxis protein